MTLLLDKSELCASLNETCNTLSLAGDIQEELLWLACTSLDPQIRISVQGETHAASKESFIVGPGAIA